MNARPPASLGLALLLLACAQVPATEGAAADVSESAAAEPGPWIRAQSLADTTAFEATGQLLAPAHARASIAMPLTATVIEMRTDKGQQVNRGDVLAVVVIPEAARAAAQLEGERLRQDAYRERLQHLERLRSEGLARGGDISETKARLRESEASALQAQALLATIEAIGLRRRGRVYEVSAPLAGVVTELRAARGAVHGPSDGPLLIVSGGEATRVEARFAFVPPPDLSYRLVVTGAPAAVLRFVARAPQLSAADATQLCWFELQAPVPLPPGTLVHVQIAPAADLWVVPRSALSATGATSLHLEGSGAHEVSVLATLGDQVLIRAQLTAEQRIRATAQVAAP